MVQHFGTDLTPLAGGPVPATDLVAFVDHAVPGLHTQFPGAPDIVIDHHEYSERIRAGFVDHRSDVGATSTILTEYLADLNRPIPTDLASMLLFALHHERLDHVRNPTRHEYVAANVLYPTASLPAIGRLYEAQLLPSTMDTIGGAIYNRQIRGSCLVSWVGPIVDRDALSQAANYLVNLQNVDTVLVAGLLGDEIHLSARSTDPDVNLGEVLRSVVGPNGHGGGHEDMAGGVIPFDRQSASPDRLLRQV